MLGPGMARVSSAWRGGSTREWRKVRARVLLRDGYRCRLQLPGCQGVAPLRGGHVHHVKGKARGDDERDLVAACRPCNLSVGDPTRGARNPEPRSMTRW